VSPQCSPRASASEPYREAIELGLSRGRNAMAIWQDLVDEYGFASSYQSVQRFVRKLHGTQAPAARVWHLFLDQLLDATRCHVQLCRDFFHSH
jgi:hypothetical protein